LQRFLNPFYFFSEMIEIFSLGGYNEVGKNCTAVKINNSMIILDMGIHLDNYIKLTEDEDIVNFSRNELIKAGAVPDINIIKDLRKKVKAIIPTHAHLDHVGAIPYLSNLFDAPLLCTPFTLEVIKAILKDEKITLKNKIKALTSNAFYYINDDVKVEFIHTTHSTPQTVMVALHTKEGIILYANDFKFDLYPTLGKKPNFKRLREIGKKGVLALIVDSTYAYDSRKMPSESVAKQMLKDVMLGTNSKDKAILITTFSSHIARLKSIIEFGKKLNRKILFLGRSLSKYSYAAEKIGLVNFSKDVEIIKYSSKIKRRLKKIREKQRGKYLLVVTGHQGEPKSTLSKIANKEIDFNLYPEDHIIFSCKVIPTKTNKENRAYLEKRLKERGVRIFRDIHVSGHAAREDLRDLINLVKPKIIIPAHGTKEMRTAMLDLAKEIGYGKNSIYLIKNGDKIKI